LEEINNNLASFDQVIHPFFDAHIAIQPSSFDHVYRWRLQQEHHMKSLYGGHGMSDDEVTRFVDRYMPVYECYAQDAHASPSLIMYFGPDREVERVETK
jgi:D-glycerate 3-kinase